MAKKPALPFGTPVELLGKSGTVLMTGKIASMLVTMKTGDDKRAVRLVHIDHPVEILMGPKLKLMVIPWPIDFIREASDG